MKKIISYSVTLILIAVLIMGVIVSTIGIETDKFNKLIYKKITEVDKNIKVNLKTLRIKFDLKEFSLFLDTLQPKISYRKTEIPIKEIRVYVDFASLIKSKPEVYKLNLTLESLEISQIKKMANIIKPSNFKNIITNRATQGKINSEIEIFLNNNILENFITKGTVSDLDLKIFENSSLTNTSFAFFADKEDVLIKNINGDFDNSKITEGNLKIVLLDDIRIESKWETV